MIEKITTLLPGWDKPAPPAPFRPEIFTVSIEEVYLA